MNNKYIQDNFEYHVQLNILFFIQMNNMIVLEANKELQSDHIGFHDPEYKKRRNEIVDKTKNFDPNIGNFETIDYLPSENQTWNKVFTTLKEIYSKFACKEYNLHFEKLVNEKLFVHDKIPELGAISKYIERNTGFKLYPVSGLLTPKQFLIGLSNKTFYCTQYIRHHSNPFYTPEPDIIHEMLGHIPLFLDQDICDISYLIGCAAKVCSEAQIKELEKIYWFSIEFGVLKDNKIYGAGILSSIDEINRINQSLLIPFDIEQIISDNPLITNFQNHYYYIESFKDLKKLISNKLNQYTI